MNTTAINYAISALRSALEQRTKLVSNHLELEDPIWVIASNTWEQLCLGTSTKRNKLFSFNLCPFTWLKQYDALSHENPDFDILFTEAGPVGYKTSNTSELTGCLQALAQRNVPTIFLKDAASHALLGLDILSDEIAGRSNRPKGLTHFFETVLKTAREKTFRNSKYAETSLKAAAAILENIIPGVSFIGRKGCTWPRLEYSDTSAYDRLKEVVANPIFSEFRSTRSFEFNFDATALRLSCGKTQNYTSELIFPSTPTPALCLLVRHAFNNKLASNTLHNEGVSAQAFNLENLRSVA